MELKDGKHMEQDEEQHLKQGEAEDVGGIIKTRRRWRSGGYSVHSSSGGGLPDLISFSSNLARIRDVFSHQVGPNVWREMIEKETFEQETFILLNSSDQRE